MPKYGCRTNKSASPVMIRSALPETANSRIILSLGSRQTVIFSIVSINNAMLSNYFNTDFLVPKLTYLSNLGLQSFVTNSLKTTSEHNKVKSATAFIKALSGTLFLMAMI
jgi:hypothetical protein